MTLRMNHTVKSPEAFKAMLAFERYSQTSGLDHHLYELIKLRASQINGCSFCIDMHSKDLIKQGESIERLMLLSVWREVPHFNAQERAVLELTEAVTQISVAGVPNDIYERVREHFDEKQFVDLIMAINSINSWNRIAVSTGMYPGCFD